MSLSVGEKIEKGKSEKDLGNAEFKKGAIKEALRHYHTAILYLSGLDNAHLNAFVKTESMAAEVKADIQSTILSIHNNMAACHIKNNAWDRAILACDKVLEKTPENAKALFRRGQSYLQLNNVDKALPDLKKAAELEPNDVGIRNELAKLKQKLKEYDEKQKKDFAGMFDRM
ncbi:Tetratricopeptide repeat protein 9A [Blyttiomyces sp. JEL0837]|nr:Tetratricopeptide repeat protein 9A [Blyttiomyces sp. JEL0837]